MKFCQIKKNKTNKIIILFVFIILSFGLYFNNVKEAKAVDLSVLRGKFTCEMASQDMADAQKEFELKVGIAVDAIKTQDMDAILQLGKINCTDNRGNIERAMDQITTWTIDKLRKELMASTAIAYKAALEHFLNTLAFDMATYLATGDKGQLPMFETEGWGGYLENVADSTAGAFLEGLGKGMPTLKFNLCRPNLDVMVKINFGLDQRYGHRPKPPACTFSQLRDNWEAALNDKDFLPKFQDMFNPWSSDLGIALTLQTGIESEISRAVNEAAHDRLEGQGFKPVRDFISKKIKTPAEHVKEAALEPLRDSNNQYFVYTGNAIADSIDIFINTLIGKLIDKWLRDGIVTDFASNGRRWNSLADPDAQNPSEGISGAESRFKTLVEPNFKVRAAYDILAELTVCPDPTKAGPTNCVIDQKFREAIEKRLTVGQALKQGYLSNALFGFLAAGSKKSGAPEPMFNQGYPYRSMLILRKFRIIPAGWEVAAQRINELADSAHTLGDLVACFSNSDNDEEDWGVENYYKNWCAGLVDPNWVLKAPQNFCAREGAGPEILSEQVTGEGAGSSLAILRNDNYCADEQSVITEGSDGSNVYGYCTEERRKWDFNGKACEPRDNTCRTFQNGEQTVSYLENTLDFGVCNAGNAGCQKYAVSGSYDGESKTVVWDGADNPVYLNKNVQTCEAADEGCHGFIRLTPDKNETYDDIKIAGLEQAYNRFSDSGLIYEKLLPDYLVDKKADGSREDYDEGVCYNERGQLKASAPSLCYNFVRQCQEEEAGCELYTSATDGSKIPAKVAPGDYCPAVCVGYDTFVQKETAFTASRVDYFIPKTAKICSAESSGCEQFTNLDEVKKGGEGIEYYTYLRQCLAKAANAESCGEFYSWEGSDESGYQLKVESLKVSDNVAAGEPVGGPAVTENDSALCDKRIYNLPLSNPAHNSDCREFYNRAGQVFYHLYKRTISCSDDCHPYRKTAEDDGSCKGGGVWDDLKKACIYMAIPGQGAVCSAAENGCREYSGNTGNDVRNIFTDDFEAALTLGDWRDGNDSMAGLELTNVSLTLQNNIGHSMLVKVEDSQAVAKRTVGKAVREGKAYVLSFLVKAAGNTTLNISLASSTNGQRAIFTPVPITGDEWQIKKTNLTNLDHQTTADEFLEITAGQNFYIDNIVLTEIVDRYYLIKDSWRDSCDYLEADTAKDYVGDLYYVGCDQYQDRAGQTHNLRQFSELCSEAAVGCELMIDTQNSTSITTEEFINDGTTVIAPADEFTYVVYDQDKLCNQEARGCALLGKSYKYESATLYGDVYLRNDPDNYKTTLCGADAVGCQTFVYGNGEKEKYFKDPGDQVCEWRSVSGQGATQKWLKKKVKRCGSDNGSVCLSDNDCSGGLKCQTEIADRDCPLDTDNGGLAKTLGKGGVGGKVSQPTTEVLEVLNDEIRVNWAGVCAAANSGCGEYIDPVSRFNANIIFNGSFADLDNDGNKTDGWSNLTQTVILEPNTVYRLARLEAGAGKLTISDCKIKVDSRDISINTLYGINQDNDLIGPKALMEVEKTTNANSKIFYYKGEAKANCTVSVGGSAGAVELKSAIVDYQLAQNLNARSCNGQVNFNKGCVLFNERSWDGANLLKLKWDADREKTDGDIGDKDKDSNVILKVTPDRVCDKWLACRSFTKDEKGNKICYDVGLCNATDDKGDCLSFLTSTKTNQTLESLGADKISNLSGYAKVGLKDGGLGGDYYPLGAMEQKGEVANLANGGFEFFGANGYPIGWNWQGGEAAKKPWDVNVFSVINNPIAAQIEGIGYAREGRAFLRLGSSFDATSEDIDVMPGTDYIITAYSNTKNLKSGTSMIDILNNTNGVIAREIITQALGNDWQFQVGKFSSGDNSRIKIKLYASVVGAVSPEGNFYFDDIKIRPALNSKDKWHTTQSCRLYPQTDSLSCDYFEDSGKRQKGWPGYCLEYDRWPGNPNACILWYPVDRVKGDGIEEGASYNGKFPVYYCLKATRPEPLNGQCSDRFKTGTEQEIILGNPYIVWDINKAKISVQEGGGANESIYGLALRNYFDQKWTGMVRADIAGANRGRTWDLAKDFDQIKMFDAVKLTCIDGDAHSDENKEWYVNNCECSGFTAEEGIMSAARCDTIAQTVNLVGQNKYWSSRVHEGSDYTINSCNAHIPNAATTCSYDSDQTPFGSIVPPSNSLSALYNPYEWDSAAGAGIQPIYYGPDNGQARLGQELSVAGVKQIFAKSYGAWNWDKQTCKGGISTGKDCVSEEGCQGVCNTYMCVNKNTGNVTDRSCEPEIADSCHSLDIGRCVLDIAQPSNVCVGGNKSFASCNAIGSNECKGCAGYSYGQCDGNKICNGGANNGSACSSDVACPDGACQPTCRGGARNGQTCSSDRECNCFSTDINTCTDSFCPNYTGGVCERKKTCNNGCHKSEVCNDNSILCGSTQCHECKASLCSDGTTACSFSNEAVCSGTCGSGKYEKVNQPTWGPPENLCPARIRIDGVYCSILPQVSNIKIQGAEGMIKLPKSSQIINLTFNSKVDSQQLPLVMLAIDWGNNEKTVITGMEMRDRPEASGQVHSFYHLYSYWDLKTKFNSGITGIDCSIPGECRVQPKIQIKDNWGWCNRGQTQIINICGDGQWDSFGTVVVREK